MDRLDSLVDRPYTHSPLDNGNGDKMEIGTQLIIAVAGNSVSYLACGATFAWNRASRQRRFGGVLRTPAIGLRPEPRWRSRPARIAPRDLSFNGMGRRPGRCSR